MNKNILDDIFLYDLIKKNQGITTQNIIKKISSIFPKLKIIDELEKLNFSKNIFRNSKLEKYYYFDSKTIFFGILYSRKNNKFIKSFHNYQSYKVANNHDAKIGDKIIFTIYDKVAKILHIAEKKNRTFFGIIYENNSKMEFIPFSGKFKKPIFINSSRITNNTVINAKIIKEKKFSFLADIIKIIGNKYDNDIDIEYVVEKNNIKKNFSQTFLNEFQKQDFSLEYTKNIKLRKDLTKYNFVTIDGADAKDLDDAFYVYRENENFVLMVSISDVSHYIQPNTIFDSEAFNRSTSIYLINSVIPMLPNELSNNLCSLNCDNKKLTISCKIIFDSHGNIIKTELFPSITKISECLTYSQVNKLFKNNDKSNIKNYEMLNDSFLLYKLLEKKYYENGYINFATKSISIILDENCKTKKIIEKKSADAEKMIEYFMLSTNKSVANIAIKNNIPFLYRVHATPDKSNFFNLLKLLERLNLNINKKNFLGEITNKKIQNILTLFKNDKTNKNMVSVFLIKCMARAKYSFHNYQHFSTGIKLYSHFTSPIRRYADLFCHQMLWKHLFLKQNIDNEIDPIKYLKITSMLNANEIKAQNCERDYVQIKKSQFLLKDSKFQKYSGIISKILEFGFFVEISNLTEGLVPISSLNTDYFFYNRDENSFLGQNTNKKYNIGDKVNVSIKRIVPNTGQILFNLVGDDFYENPFYK